jgi:hypothetical protein
MTMSTKKVGPKKRGRPYAGGRDPSYSLRMPPEMRRQMEKLAREDGVTLSRKILQVLAEHLAKRPQ